MSTPRRIKQGSRFTVSGVLIKKDAAGVNILDCSTWNNLIQSQVRDANGTLVETLSAVWVDRTKNSFRVQSGAGGVTWPEGFVVWDIKFFPDADSPLLLESIRLQVVKSATHA